MCWFSVPGIARCGHESSDPDGATQRGYQQDLALPKHANLECQLGNQTGNVIGARPCSSISEVKY